MKILQIVYSCVPGQFRGGVSKVVYDLCRAQVILGHEVTIYTTNYNSSVPVVVPLETPVTSEGVIIQYHKVSNARWFTSPDMYNSLLQNTTKYDVLHSHNIFLAPNLYASRVQMKFRKPLFYHVHGSLDPLVFNRGFVKRLRKTLYFWMIERRNFDRATGLFTLSEAERCQIRNRGINAPVIVVPNGVWVDDYTVKNKGKDNAAHGRLGDPSLRILYIGRIVPKKGLHILIKAFAKVRATFPNAVLLLGGDREQDRGYVQQLDKLICDLSLGASVRWLGYLNEDAKRSLLGTAAVFSHVSESEGMAMAVLEAMAAGLPVVVSKGCYMTDAVKARAVIECEFDADNLAAVLENLLVSSRLREDVGSNAQRYVRDHHSWPTIAQKVIDTYQSALDRKQRS